MHVEEPRNCPIDHWSICADSYGDEGIVEKRLIERSTTARYF